MFEGFVEYFVALKAWQWYAREAERKLCTKRTGWHSLSTSCVYLFHLCIWPPYGSCPSAPAQQFDFKYEQLILMPYSRTPPAFKDALLYGPDLDPIRRSLINAGLSFTFEPSGAKLFVWPEQYTMALDVKNSIGFERLLFSASVS